MGVDVLDLVFFGGLGEEVEVLVGVGHLAGLGGVVHAVYVSYSFFDFAFDVAFGWGV